MNVSLLVHGSYTKQRFSLRFLYNLKDWSFSKFRLIPLFSVKTLRLFNVTYYQTRFTVSVPCELQSCFSPSHVWVSVLLWDIFYLDLDLDNLTHCKRFRPVRYTFFIDTVLQFFYWEFHVLPMRETVMWWSCTTDNQYVLIN